MQAAGRSSREITLIAITKTFPASDVRLLAGLGVRDVGENRDQEAAPKAAAVADYRPKVLAGQKMKRTGPITIEFEPTEDILREVVASKRPGTLVIGFAAETEHLIGNGRDKLLRKGADAIVLNDGSQPGLGFDSDRNAATFLTTRTAIELPEMTKLALASRILDEVIALRRPASMVAETGLVSSNSKLQE